MDAKRPTLSDPPSVADKRRTAAYVAAATDQYAREGNLVHPKNPNADANARWLLGFHRRTGVRVD